MQQRYPLAASTWGDEEVEAACRVIRSGQTTMGEKVREFERLFALHHNVRHAVMVNSGSSANLLMVAALAYTGRLPRGSRVAVPAVSWSTTYAPLEQFGHTMVMVDVDDTFNIAPEQIPDDVDAIFGVNLLGNPMDFDRLPQGPLLLEDNCESHGRHVRGDGQL
jgi:CDP-6-deoxy-D-xylo-4-hexulose-3-dehydrase